MRKIVLILMASAGFFGMGQVDKKSDLHLEMEQVDHTLFQKGFNECDLDYLEKVIHSDLIFYHDQSGIQDRKVFFENTKKYICNDENGKPIRKVIPESLQVFPLYDSGELYGVIQRGEHAFYLRHPDKDDVFTAKAAFTHVYLKQGDHWVLKEVLSFNHHN